MSDQPTRPSATIRLDLEYEGTRFAGWARQPGARTVQGEVEGALTVLLRRPVALSVAGRTDAGVHAAGQVASFVALAEVVPERLRLGLNALLPRDIAVHSVACAPPGFDARAALARTYRYRLWLAPTRSALNRDFVWHIFGHLDTELLASLAELFVGRRDWRALTPSADLYHTCVREVVAARWSPTPGSPGPAREWVFEVTAGSFLHRMVRVMVGSMVDVALGRRSRDDLVEGLAAGERGRMGRTAPARGLTLVRVDY